MRARALALSAVFILLLIGVGRAVDDHDHLLHPDPTCPICHTQQTRVMDAPVIEPFHLFDGIFHPVEASPQKIYSQIPENHNSIRGPPLAS